MDDDLSRFCRPDPDCRGHGKRGHGNLTVCMRHGRQRRRLLHRRTCKARLSERKGTPLFDARRSEDKALAVPAHRADGCGVRQTGRLVGVGRNTVIRYGPLAGGHARRPHDELVGFSPLDGPGAAG